MTSKRLDYLERYAHDMVISLEASSKCGKVMLSIAGTVQIVKLIEELIKEIKHERQSSSRL